MRSAVFALVLLTAAAVFAEDPKDAFEDLLEAVYEGDAAGVADRLSTDTIAMMDMVVAMIKLQPAEAAEEFTQELGTEVTTEDIMGWTSIDFLNAVILSPGFLEDLPAREEIAITHCEISGDSSTVFLSVSGINQPFGMAMVLEDDSWKLAENLIQGPVQ